MNIGLAKNERWEQLTRETCCVVFDTETNGLFRKRGKNPRMVALAWSIFSVGKGSIRKQSFIVQADDFDPNPSGLLKHGIDRARALRDGIPVKAILEEFDRDIDLFGPQLLVAHNIEFDVQVLISECQRTGFDLSRALNLPRFCTMKETTSLLAIPRGDNGEYDRRIEAYRRDHNMRTKKAKRGLEFYERVLSEEISRRQKWPSLQELSQHLLGVSLENWHDALADVEACEQCFRKLAEKMIAEHAAWLCREEKRKVTRELERQERERRQTIERQEREKHEAAQEAERMRRQERATIIKRSLIFIIFYFIAALIIIAICSAIFG